MARKAESKHEEPSEIEKGQAQINIGLVGHVDHGKTTLTEQLSGRWTDTHSEEIKRGITIRLGYADTVLRKCPKCDEPKCYTTKAKCPLDGEVTVPLRKVSFVDAPGHESLMATMLSGATIMDGALLLVAANEECPQPQTREHLVALEMAGIQRIIIVQNKIDLCSRGQVIANYKQIVEFVKDTPYKDSPIVPISAQHALNIDVLIKTIYEYFEVPKHDITKDPIMLVARSFDINKPGKNPKDIVGGVLGGTLKQGVIKIGDELEIRPGYEQTIANKKTWFPLFTTAISLMAGSLGVDKVNPGGSVAVGTTLDPSIVKSDALVGSVVGLKSKLPQVWDTLVLEVHLLNRVVGSKQELVVEPIKMKEPLMLNTNSSATVGFVTKMEKNKITVTLKKAVCAEKAAKVTISRRVENRFRLIGFGIIR